MTEKPAVDLMSPWTIKSVPTSTKEAVIKAARQAGLTVGQWLEARVREWTEDGQPIRSAEVANPGRPPAPDLAGIGAAMSGLAALVTATGIKPPRAAVRALYSVSDDVARQHRGQPPRPVRAGKAAGKTLALPKPASD